jgi:hypothetical protein
MAGVIFPTKARDSPFQTVPGTDATSCLIGAVVKLTTDLHLMLRSRMMKMPLLSDASSWHGA